jgi:hypothetical protein
VACFVYDEPGYLWDGMGYRRDRKGKGMGWTGLDWIGLNRLAFGLDWDMEV